MSSETPQVVVKTTKHSPEVLKEMRAIGKRPGTLKEIRKYQTHSGPLIPRTSLASLARCVVIGNSVKLPRDKLDFKFNKNALRSAHEVLEWRVTDILRRAYKMARSSNRQTLYRKDIDATLELLNMSHYKNNTPFAVRMDVAEEQLKRKSNRKSEDEVEDHEDDEDDNKSFTDDSEVESLMEYDDSHHEVGSELSDEETIEFGSELGNDDNDESGV